MKQNDIVLVPFPYSDQKHKKIRPAAIISNNEYNKSNDIIVCGITSNIEKKKYSVKLKELDIPSRIRVDNIMRLDKRLILKKIGEMQKDTCSEVRKQLRNLFSTKN